MLVINYPEPGFRLKKENDREWLFDPIRKKWLVLTPEEWVRQNFLQYLLQQKNYPSSLIAVEKEINLGELKKRFDIVIYDTNTKPWMIVECKEMNVPLNEAVLEQSLRYNITLQVKYIVITNGSHCFAFENDNGKMIELTELPLFN